MWHLKFFCLLKHNFRDFDGFFLKYIFVLGYAYVSFSSFGGLTGEKEVCGGGRGLYCGLS